MNKIATAMIQRSGQRKPHVKHVRLRVCGSVVGLAVYCGRSGREGGAGDGDGVRGVGAP